MWCDWNICQTVSEVTLKKKKRFSWDHQKVLQPAQCPHDRVFYTSQSHSKSWRVYSRVGFQGQFPTESHLSAMTKELLLPGAPSWQSNCLALSGPSRFLNDYTRDPVTRKPGKCSLGLSDDV